MKYAHIGAKLLIYFDEVIIFLKEFIDSLRWRSKKVEMSKSGGQRESQRLRESRRRESRGERAQD